MPTLRPFRSLDEYDTLNFYGYSGSYPVQKGTFVRIAGTSGYMGQDLDIIGQAGASYAGVDSPRWGVVPAVTAVSATGDLPIGILLYDGKELDENGLPLKFNPRKAAEMQVFQSGQAAPIATAGEFLYSGVSGTPTPGAPAYFDPLTAGIMTVGQPSQIVGKFLGGKDGNGYVYVKISL
jgi:hypothetical protein